MFRTYLRQTFGFFLITLGLLPALPAESAEPSARATLDAILAAVPSGPRLMVTEPLVVTHETFRFELRSGELHFFPPLAGRYYGAYFQGEGMVSVTPSSASEAAELARLSGASGSRSMVENVGSLLVLAASPELEELALRAEPVVGEDARTWQSFEALRRVTFGDRRAAVAARLLAALREPATAAGLLYAAFDGDALPPTVMVSDPAGVCAAGWTDLDPAGTLGLFVRASGEPGYWYLEEGAARGAGRPREQLDLEHVGVTLTFAKRDQIHGEMQADLRVEASVAQLPFRLSPALVIESAEVRLGASAAFEPLELLREGPEGWAILPRAVAEGDRVRLRIRYAGKLETVLVGEGFAAPIDPEAWLVDFRQNRDRATYELRYQLPKELEVSSTGRPANAALVGKLRAFVWKSAGPTLSPGFVMGKALHYQAAVGSPLLNVELLRSSRPRSVPTYSSTRDSGGPATSTTVDRSTGTLQQSRAASDPTVLNSPERVAGRFLRAKGKTSLEVFAQWVDTLGHWFGPLPERRLRLIKAEANEAAMSWHGMASAQRPEVLSFAERHAIAQLARQWWGEAVGFQEPDAAWLPFGLQALGAALVVEVEAGREAYLALLDQARVEITAPRAGSTALNDAARLATVARGGQGLSAAETETLLAAKGLLILAAVRERLRNTNSATPDEAFRALLHTLSRTRAHETADQQAFTNLLGRLTASPDLADSASGLVTDIEQWVQTTALPSPVSRPTGK